MVWSVAYGIGLIQAAPAKSDRTSDELIRNDSKKGSYKKVLSVDLDIEAV